MARDGLPRSRSGSSPHSTQVLGGVASISPTDKPTRSAAFAPGSTKPRTATGKVAGIGTNFGPALREQLKPQFVEYLARKRPAALHVAMLVDRGATLLPVRADVVGVRLDIAPSDIIECNVPPYESEFKIELLQPLR